VSRREWTTTEARRLIELREQGYRMRDIARLLGRSEHSLFAFQRHHASYKRRPSKPLRRHEPSERLRIATLVAIAAYANSNGLDIDGAARRLLMGRR
jgi:transposase-like protein